MILFESRASVILLNLLKKNKFKNKFLLPLNICPIVPCVFLKAKVDFDFIDISLDTLCIDEDKVLERLKHDINISGVLFVHTFGVDLEVEAFFKKIKAINSDLFIIDDRCLMIPDFSLNIQKSNADMALFSTGYSKYVDINWGGFAFLKDKYSYMKTNLIFKQKDLEELSENTQECINSNFFFEYKDTNWIGSNKNLYNSFEKYKKDILEQTFLMNKQKEKLNNIYLKNLQKDIFLGEKFNDWRFSILVENKEKLLNKIFGNKLFASSHYKEIDYMFKKKYLEKSNVKTIHSKIVNLFNDFRFDEVQAYKIVDVINKHINEY